MRIKTERSEDGTWSITPTEGKFAGRCIGKADEIRLSDTSISKDGIHGHVVAVWGLEFTDHSVYDDSPTVLGVCIGNLNGIARGVRSGV